MNDRKQNVFGESTKKLNNINITFKNKNYNLDIKQIKLTFLEKKKGLKIPPKITPKLAEEVGMHLGDGFLSSKRPDFRLKGNKKDEREYYDNYIRKLYKSLFNIDLNIREYESTYGFELYSRSISEFKSRVLQLPTGRKYDKLKIPEIFKINDINIITSLLRGLFDTDGTINFQSRYGYHKYYPQISITQKSQTLIKDVYEILKMLGFNPSLSITKDYFNISLYGYSSLKKYMDLIGFSNPKHLRKINDWKQYGGRSVAW